MSIKRILTAAVTGTTFMTLFSEVVSKLDGNNYNEAKILGELIDRITPLNEKTSQAAGWIGHYGVGVLFAAGYDEFLERTGTKPSILNGAVYGALSGLVGAAVWHSTFKAHPNPPGVNLKKYYKQLVIAHAVFGIAASLTYPENKK